MALRKIRVLVVDDSALVREVLTGILSQDRRIEVVGTAADPIQAAKKIKELKPDVITLDLEMPRMDGLTFLEKLMASFPLPVIVISSMAQKGGSATIRALELGAIDFVTKPALGVGAGLKELFPEIAGKVKNAAAANLEVLRRQARQKKTEPLQSLPKEPVEMQQAEKNIIKSTDKVIAIGASTGGTVAVKSILSLLPANLPGILVVLHMPPTFTASYAQSLNNSCRLKVKEAADGDTLSTGCVYIAPGDKHMLLDKNSLGFHLRIDSGPPVNHHRPSVDKMFYSVAGIASSNSMGVILTGMGGDGARGLKEMHDRGSYTIVQDKKTSVVFGMPRQAISLGAADRVLPLEEIAGAIVNYIKGEMIS